MIYHICLPWQAVNLYRLEKLKTIEGKLNECIAIDSLLLHLLLFRLLFFFVSWLRMALLLKGCFEAPKGSAALWNDLWSSSTAVQSEVLVQLWELSTCGYWDCLDLNSLYFPSSFLGHSFKVKKNVRHVSWVSDMNVHIVWTGVMAQQKETQPSRQL